jgi:hypothetical protein
MKAALAPGLIAAVNKVRGREVDPQ